MQIEQTLVNPMIRDAAIRYCANIQINQSNRSPEQAQEFHICHMFLHNFYKGRRPQFCVPGGKTIAWSHLSDPSVKWVLIDVHKSTFLLTKGGRPARLKGVPPEWEEAPDEVRSRHAMAKFLEKYRVSGMAAPGVHGCGEPCHCGASQSKHVSGEACDLHGLDWLGSAMIAAERGKYHDPIEAVDEFLKQHSLYRPMGHMKGKRQELWHVEAIPHHLKHIPHSQLKHHIGHLVHHHGGC
jgi:hypothetical protein